MTKISMSGRKIMLLLVASITSIANAQQQDYSNYVKLDSIIYPDGRNDYKYDFKYDKKNGNQTGFVRHIKNYYDWRGWGNSQPWFEECDFYSGTGGAGKAVTIMNERKNTVLYYGNHFVWEYTYDDEGKLTESVYYNVSNQVIVRRTFDGVGRPTGLVINIDDRWSGDLLNASVFFQYHENGKLGEMSEFWQSSMSDGYQGEGEDTYRFDSNGRVIYKHERTWNNKPFEYLGNVYNGTLLTEEREETYSYDEDPKLMHRTIRSKETLDPVEKEFIESLTVYDLHGNVERPGQEEFERRFNVWRNYEEIRPTNDKLNYDSRGNVISSCGIYSRIKENYSYDENNRMISQTISLMHNEDQVRSRVYHLEYWYDEAGNRMIKEDRKSMTTPEPSSIKKYDISGNLIEETATHEGHTYRYEYTYNAKKQMRSVSMFVDSELKEKIEYDTMTPSFKTGGIVDIPYSDIESGMDGYVVYQANYSMNHLVYLFDQPYRVKSYKVYGDGMEHDVQLYYSKFIEEENAIENVTADEEFRTEYYDMQGRKRSAPAQGVNIMRKNGKTVKVLIK